MAGDSGEHVLQVGEGIDVVTLAGGDEAEQDRGGAAAVVAAAEEPRYGDRYEWHEDKHGSPLPSSEGALKDASGLAQEIVLLGSPFDGSRLDSVGAVRQLVLRDPSQEQFPQGPPPFAPAQELSPGGLEPASHGRVKTGQLLFPFYTSRLLFLTSLFCRFL